MERHAPGREAGQQIRKTPPRPNESMANACKSAANLLSVSRAMTARETDRAIAMTQKSWPVQDAKARFSELLETCLRDGPQVVTKRGTETAVLVDAKEWRRLQQSARPSLKDLLLSDEARGNIPVPKRGELRRRTPPSFD
jgi:antitoxin Phd